MARTMITSSSSPLPVLTAFLLVAFLEGVTAVDEGPNSCDDVRVQMNLTPHEAGLVAVIALIVLGVVGLLCIFLFAVACGYRVRANELSRKLKDVEMASKSSSTKTASLPSTVAYYADPQLEFPPPPPETPPPPPPDVNDNKEGMDGTEDVKPPIDAAPDSSAPEVHVVEVTPEPTGGEVNGGYTDDAVEEALGDMDAAVAGADSASLDVADGSAKEAADGAQEATDGTQEAADRAQEAADGAQEAADGAQEAAELEGGTPEVKTEATEAQDKE